MRTASDETVRSYMFIFSEIELIVYKIELEENEDIIICSSWSGFIWRPHIRSLRRLIQ